MEEGARFNNRAPFFVKRDTQEMLIYLGEKNIKNVIAPVIIT